MNEKRMNVYALIQDLDVKRIGVVWGLAPKNCRYHALYFRLEYASQY